MYQINNNKIILKNKYLCHDYKLIKYEETYKYKFFFQLLISNLFILLFFDQTYRDSKY